jgi:hypothetical protein
MLNVAPILFSLLLIQAGPALLPDEPAPRGVIYGTVVDQDGHPAKGIALQACPLGVPLAAVLPTTVTDDSGNYRFQNIPWWGRYTVYAEDEKAGYSSFITNPASPASPAEITLSPEHPMAAFNVRLPPKAAFLHLHLTNRRTNSIISAVEVKVTLQAHPEQFIYSMSCLSDRVFLLPPEQDLLLHITSPGFVEWNESDGAGKPLRMRSGDSRLLEVQLEPVDR